MANWSGLWDRQYGIPYTQLGTQIGYTENTIEFNSTKMLKLAKTLRQRGDRVLARIMYALTGAAAGGSASENLSRLTAVQGLGDALSNGGQRTVASVSLVNRVTTAADVTLVQRLLTQTFGPTLVSGYVRDTAGNGGGGKVGAF